METRHVRLAIVGSGFAGIGTGIRLKEDGLEDFVIFERADDLGGTWRDNSYPGCACDVPSHLYSFSFAPNPRWTSTFSGQPEIWAYLRECADRYGIRPHIRFGEEVLEAVWDEDARRWRLRTSTGELTADVLVSGAGALSEPSVPDLVGVETFAGTAFHSAQWNHEHDLTGRNVAVVGTGASAIQFVPQIQPQVRSLLVFQRTPPWVVPRRDRPLTRFEHGLYRTIPPAQRAMRGAIFGVRELFVLRFIHPREGAANERLARRHLEKQVTDPELRAKLTPDYRMGCKRILISNDFYPALTQPNVTLVTQTIREIRPNGIVTADGVEHILDTIVFGTGFHVTDLPIAERVRGRDGRTLAETWSGSPRAHLGTTVNGFPNLFVLLGPNTGLGHNSVVYMIEAQIEHLRGALRTLERERAAVVEPRADAQEAFNADVDRRMAGTVWTTGGCKSWYLDSTGRNSTIWPGFSFNFRKRVARFDPKEYVIA
jgi:cation diffusion facilitator CzcD-associated flavoprotein CzcO